MKKLTAFFTAAALSLLCACGTAAPAQTSASADAGAAFARGKAIVCTRQDEEVPAPDAAGTGTSEPMSITDQWSGSSFSACRFAVNGSFRTCSGQGCCRVAAADGTIRYFRYSDGAFQPREASPSPAALNFPARRCR